MLEDRRLQLGLSNYPIYRVFQLQCLVIWAAAAHALTHGVLGTAVWAASGTKGSISGDGMQLAVPG